MSQSRLRRSVARSPFSFTIAAAVFPLANISAKTSLPCLPLIFPLSIKLTSSSSASGRNWTIVYRFASSAERVLQIVQDPVSDILRFLRVFGGRLEISRNIEIVRPARRRRRAHLILLDEPRAFRLRQFRQRARAPRSPASSAFHRHQIRIGKITIIVREFLGPHEKRFARGIIPAARFLLEFFAALERCDLPLRIS